MSRAEKFIQNYTRNCSNECWDAEGSYHPWLSIDEALKAVEIAKEEIYEWLENNLSAYDACDSCIEKDRLLKDLKAMNEKLKELSQG